MLGLLVSTEDDVIIGVHSSVVRGRGSESPTSGGGGAPVLVRGGTLDGMVGSLDESAVSTPNVRGDLQRDRVSYHTLES